MNILGKGIGVGLIGLGLGFGYFMDGIGEINKDHTFEVQFQRGLTPRSEFVDIAADITRLMRANPDYVLVIKTHTGDRGPEDSNLQLSEDRLDHLIDELDGIPANRIVGQALGETELLPREKHETDTLWQKRLNRAEFKVTVQP